MELIRPALVHLPSYVAALERGWSPDNLRGAAAAREQLAKIEADPQAFLALTHLPAGGGDPVRMPDGSTRERLPSVVRWMWDEEGFSGSISLRWAAGGASLPSHVLGHIGYAVVPWKRRRGYATQALGAILPLAREAGLGFVDITTDPENTVSQRVITANGGVLIEQFEPDPVWGRGVELRYRITLR